MFLLQAACCRLHLWTEAEHGFCSASGAHQLSSEEELVGPCKETRFLLEAAAAFSQGWLE